MAGFFDLPSEMRNRVYDFLLRSSPPNLNVLTASRLLHEEAASYYYQNNTFAVDLAEDVVPGAVIVSPIFDKYLKCLRILTVNIKLGYNSPVKTIDQAQRLVALADHSNLTTLTLNITSVASKVVSSTIDDCVLHVSHPLTLALQHLLSRDGACSLRVNLHGVWFAPGVGSKLLCGFEGSLAVSSDSLIERTMQGQVARDHMRDLGLDDDDLDDAEDLQQSDFADNSASLPSPLKSALSALDAYSPTEYQDEDTDRLGDPSKDDHSDSQFDEPMFDEDDLEEVREDELTEEDDVDDAAMEDVDDIEAILDNLAGVHNQRMSDRDICYMTNFAPNMLRSLSRKLA